MPTCRAASRIESLRRLIASRTVTAKRCVVSHASGEARRRDDRTTGAATRLGRAYSGRL